MFASWPSFEIFPFVSILFFAGRGRGVVIYRLQVCTLALGRQHRESCQPEDKGESREEEKKKERPLITGHLYGDFSSPSQFSSTLLDMNEPEG